MTATRLLGLALTLAACASVSPVPTPGTDAGAADVPTNIFTGQVFDCHQAVVANERGDASLGVSACLGQQDATSCLVGLTATYQAATVACLARDLGADANAAALVNPDDTGRATVAGAARSFITSCRVDYR